MTHELSNIFLMDSEAQEAQEAENFQINISLLRLQKKPQDAGGKEKIVLDLETKAGTER
ncbi:uncharacterized protein Dyak_GE27982, isoform B [Drosophila yakuba]|uniref:Uncharacterized protein, isoform B n=1 Tax=Drosophila yakuba TaxID=7245 RepID=A0A0R1E1P5_DROYA|nr:uncharacterized protein Dyak_GE27982, isoform B [Drosophila yakuba]